MISKIILCCFWTCVVIFIPPMRAIGKEDDVEDYEYDDGFDDSEEMGSYERVMRGKRSVEDYAEDYDYEDEDIEDYDTLDEDGEDDDDESEEEEEEEDEDYTDGEPITKNIADKDERIKEL